MLRLDSPKLAVSAALVALCAACQNTLPATNAASESTAAEEVTLEDLDYEVVPLQYAQSYSLAKTLKQVFTGSTIRIGPDTRTNTILLGGQASEVAEAKVMIAQLDVEVTVDGPPTQTVEVILLEHARADDVRDSLDDVFDRSSRVSVDERRNALIVNASPASMERIKELIAELDSKQ